MWRTVILAGEGNVGYIDLTGSPSVSAAAGNRRIVSSWDKYEFTPLTSRGIDENTANTHCLLSHDFKVYSREDKWCERVSRAPKRRHASLVSPSFTGHTGRLYEVKGHSFILFFFFPLQSQGPYWHLKAAVRGDTDVKTALTEMVPKGRGWPERRE